MHNRRLGVKDFARRASAYTCFFLFAGFAVCGVATAGNAEKSELFQDLLSNTTASSALNDFSICTEAHFQYHPAVAFGGTNYLTVWTDERANNPDVYGQLIDPDGQTIGGNFAVCTQSASQYNPAVGSSPTNHLIVWEDNRNGNSDIYGQLVDKNGSPVGMNFPICDQTHDQYHPAVAFGNSMYLVVWRDNRSGAWDIYGLLISIAGGSFGTEFVICGNPNGQDHPAVAFDGGKFLVVWTDWRNSNRDIYGQYVGEFGGLLQNNMIVTLDGHHQYKPAIAFDGTNYLVAWIDERDGNTAVYGQWIWAGGASLIQNFPICSDAHNQNQYSPAVAFNGSKHLVVWQDYRSDTYEDIYGQVIGSNGYPIGGNFPVCNNERNQYAPKMASNGSKFLIVWHDFRNNQPDIYGRLMAAPTAMPQLIPLLFD